ncbi:MAG: serine/threonine-protein kinase [Pseudomonadota bacterium]
MSTSERDDGLQRDAMAEMDRLLDKSQPERARHLDALAHSRPELHALVMNLLSYEDSINKGFMEPKETSVAKAIQAGSPLGPYRIIRLLGEGGMGAVWLAARDDGLYDGQVAIKTLHPYFAGGALRDRFLREAKVLGRLAHSNIARLLDAGIHDGVVYLVLEYVVGRPLDVACDEKQLDIAARLGIFAKLCAGVAHAHSSLVIHRDIKPGNVLLTPDGVPKLLDFGIANFYEPEMGSQPSDITRLTGRVFTPEYAAPEQVLGEEITTAADVYSLGVLLYVLLAGKLPYEVASRERATWEHSVVHHEPRRMVRVIDTGDHEALARDRTTTFARLRRELGGDLENIVQKALKKRPEDRYPTVAAFADDIRRYLEREPVLARADSAWYRIRQFSRRNRLAVGATLAVVVALGSGFAVSLWQLQVARVERQRAEESKEFIASIFRSADPFYTGKDSMTAVELLTLARERIDSELVAQPQNAVELLTLVGESQMNLSQDGAAKETLTKAIEMAERLRPRDDVLIAEARARLGVIASENGEYAQVRSIAALTLPDLRKHQPRTGRLLNEMLISLAYAESEDGNPEAAIALAREGVAAVAAALGPAHSETISARYHLATFIQDAGRLEDARLVAEQVLRDARALASPGHSGALVIQAEGRYGTVLLEMGELQAAISHLNAANELAAQLYGPTNPSRYTWFSSLARAQSRLGDFKGLLNTRRQAYEGNQEPGLGQARELVNLARSTFAARMVQDSLDLLRHAIELEQQHDVGKGSWIVLAQSDYGAALALSGKFGQADELLHSTLQLARESAKDDSLESTWNAIGLARQLRSQWDESERAFREALANTASSASNQKFRAEALQGIGVARLALGRAGEAEDWLRQADESVRKTFVGMTPLRADIAMNLGRTLLAQDKIVAANESFAAVNAYWLDFDASNRCAGQAAYWAARGHFANGARQEARAQFTRAIDILKSSALPDDVRLVADARRTIARL